MSTGSSRSAGCCRLPRRATDTVWLGSARLHCASPRARRDDTLVQHIKRVWRANLQVYGAKKVWRQLRRESHVVARRMVERLMHRHGLRGVIRGKVVRTTVSDPKAACPLDEVNRRRGSG